MMVPGVKRDPAVLYRDQTHTLVSAVAPTSIKFLELVVGAAASPAFQPTFNAFPTNVAAAEGDNADAYAGASDAGDNADAGALAIERQSAQASADSDELE